MTKNKRREIEETRKVLYGIVNEIELEYGVQILQNNEKFEDLAAKITSSTKTSTYSEFLSELYFRVAQLKEVIISELAASKNNSFPRNGYVLSINT